ncbi:PREDICTED: nucleolar MIF4G domain-containing protein 1 [Ceratosolen solmsi marchali]|uniref:Nucleolar MIF4G domain-containing protein 1 n=1 Tax=Ceratosolen solmsi marchali TaxID=326594 RepID=A0AAJ6YE34_9HYME|nr:PREDICTED: nucleolar MIF4G domain-containing protein 1 [Ceratosolen solmsi marchali]
MNKKEKYINKKRKLKWKKDNLVEDRVIKKLEKKLKINRKTKCVPKSFVSDGLDYLLDICDEENRKIVADGERKLLETNEYKNCDNDSNTNNVIKSKSKSKDHDCEQTESMSDSENLTELSSDNGNESDINYTSVDDDINNKQNLRQNKYDVCTSYRSNHETASSNDNFNDSIDTKFAVKRKKCDKEKDSINLKNITVKKKKTPSKNSFEKKTGKADIDSSIDKSNSDVLETNLNSMDANEEIDDEDKEGVWEDIYGRKRNKDGSIISEKKQKYILPALRSNDSDNAEKSKQLMLLKRQIKGLLNRLAESNMHVIVSQLDELYMSNSRNTMNEMLSNIMLESIVAPILTAERLVIEHMMCIAILHANIGTEIGAHFIMSFIQTFNKMIQEPLEVENKELDNVCLMMAHLYNFKVFGSQLVYQILEYLANKFTEKEIELILLFLRTTGFRLRKDDPVSLKELILNLQQKAAGVKATNSRVQFMLEILLAIKNNNTNKIPQYDQSHIDHLKKLLKTLIRKGNTISQLNLSLEDLLNVDEKGKWWVVGSAWSGKLVPNEKVIIKPNDNKPVYSQKILNLAQAQRMNTDIRKNIFCILMTAEDYLDAFEKLHHLGLKDQQEREIIYVILNCLLQERTFNPYYSVLIQKFCEYDRKYQMIMQYTLWDKLKMLNSYNNKQVICLARLMSHLFLHKALPISVLKVIDFGELDKLTMKFFKKIMLDILLHQDTEKCVCVFERISVATKLHEFRDGLRLFINYFLLKNINENLLPKEQFELLETRIKMVDELLINSESKIAF